MIATVVTGFVGLFAFLAVAIAGATLLVAGIWLFGTDEGKALIFAIVVLGTVIALPFMLYDIGKFVLRQGSADAAIISAPEAKSNDKSGS